MRPDCPRPHAAGAFCISRRRPPSRCASLFQRQVLDPLLQHADQRHLVLYRILEFDHRPPAPASTQSAQGQDIGNADAPRT
jgi:hypothetical protein